MPRCIAITKKGTRCTQMGKIYKTSHSQSLNGLCNLHINFSLSGKTLNTIPKTKTTTEDINYRKNTLISELINVNFPKNLALIIFTYDSSFGGKILITLDTNNTTQTCISSLSDGRLVSSFNSNNLKIWGDNYSQHHISERRNVLHDIILEGHITL